MVKILSGDKDGRTGPGSLLLSLVLLAGLTLLSGKIMAGETELQEKKPFRVAFTSSMFTEVNVDDARAAMKVWIMTVAKQWGIATDCTPYIYKTVEGLVKFSRENNVDGFGLTTPEYERLIQSMQFDQVVLGTLGKSYTREYLLLVRSESGVGSLDQLAGGSLKVLHNPNMSLAVTWLDTLLLEKGLPPADDFFGNVDLDNKAARVVLPVFFGKADACLVSRDVFELMGKLNPQISNQLKPVASSPGLIGACFVFRSDYISDYRAKILMAMERLNESPGGRQILVLTKSDRIVTHPSDCMNESLELLARHRRLCREAGIKPEVILQDAAANGAGAE